MPYKDPEKAREGQRRYRQKNREKQREYQHQHRLKNKERINERARARYHQHGKEQKHLNYLKNKERAREYNQKYYLNNKEQLREKHRAYWQKYYQSLKGKTHKQEYLKEYGQRPEIKEKNRNYQRELRRSNPKVQEYHRRYMCEWRINNPLYAKLKDKVKRARLHSVYHAPYSQDEVDAQLVEQNYLDFYTDKPLFNGSIEPDISEDHIIPISKRGPDILQNIVFCTKKTNRSKYTRSVCEFLEWLVNHGEITQEAADRKLTYLRERLGEIQASEWLSDWYKPEEFEHLFEESVGDVLS